MKKLLIGLALVSVLSSCGGSNESTDAAQTTTEAAEADNTETKAPKFEDEKGCSKYANLFEALPQLDTYKDLSFGNIDCIHMEGSSPFSTNLNVSYFNNDTRTNFELNIFEVSGQSAKEEMNNVNLAKASYNELTKVASSNTVNSGLTTFENASVNISQSADEKEVSKATYMATYKDKYSFWIDVEMTGKMDVSRVDALLKDYLEAINKDKLK